MTTSLAKTKYILLTTAFLALGSLSLPVKHAYALDNTPAITYHVPTAGSANTNGSNNAGADNAQTVATKGSEAAQESGDTDKQANTAASTGADTVHSETKDLKKTVTDGTSNMTDQAQAVVGAANGNSKSRYNTQTGNPLENLMANLKNGMVWLISNGMSLVWMVGFAVLIFGIFRAMWGAVSKKGTPKEGMTTIVVAVVMLVLIGSIQWVPGVATWVSGFLKSLFS